MTYNRKLSYSNLSGAFIELCKLQLPRWLSQVSRDPNDPAYGCFDRNWWHYRMRDFPSIILQQGGYAVHLASDLYPHIISQSEADKLACAACLFWQKRALKHGAFEEYYPWEQGYPPLAFSTLAVAKMVDKGVVPLSDMLPGLRVAARQLSKRFEPQAANQQVAGLAALAWLRRLNPNLVSEAILEKITTKTLALQTDEGWFWEYDGPDTGYLSVTLDCLWDAWDATRDNRFATAAFIALDFIYTCVSNLETGMGMLNARNTDYLVPYGLVRCLNEGDESVRNKASTVLTTLFNNLSCSSHFLHAIDDRYWCHYIGHSVIRATQELKKLKDAPLTLEPIKSTRQLLDKCGYLFEKHENGIRFCTALRKGGSFALHHSSGAVVADYGWVIKSRNKQQVTHWWTEEWKFEDIPSKCEAKVEGTLVSTKPLSSNPWMHVVLRFISLIFGRSLISSLKNVMIFKQPTGKITFQRRFKWEEQTLVVYDKIEGLKGNEEIIPAPRASKRHVASADSFHLEDFSLNKKTNHHIEIERSGKIFRAAQRWSLMKDT